MGLGPGGAGATGGQAGEGRAGETDADRGDAGGVDAGTVETDIDTGLIPGPDREGLLGISDSFERALGSAAAEGLKGVAQAAAGVLGLVGGIMSGNVVAGAIGAKNVRDGINAAKALANLPDSDLRERGLDESEISNIRDLADVDTAALADRFSGEEHGAEYTTNKDGFLVEVGEEVLPGIEDAPEDSVSALIRESYEDRPGLDPTDLTSITFDEGAEFETPAWDAFVDEWLGVTGKPSFEEAFGEAAAFQRAEAEGLIEAVERETGEYGGLLDNLIGQAQEGTGIFTPLKVMAAGQNLNFVPRPQREFAEQIRGLGKERLETGLLAPKTRYETAAERDPSRARLGFLEAMAPLARETADIGLRRQELADVSRRGYGGLAIEAQKAAAPGLVLAEKQRQFDLEYARKIREFGETGEREERKIEAEEPGVLDYIIGGAELLGTIF